MTAMPTRKEAVEKLRELIARRLAAGGEVFGLDISSRDHPLARFAGMFKDDPLLQPCRDAMAEHRAEQSSD
jgi:hypothetical protein